MANDEFGDKTEQPTPRRLEEAREDGRIPRSTELTAAFGLLAGLLLLRFMGRDLFEDWLELALALGHVSNPRADGLGGWALQIVALAAQTLAPWMGVLMLVGIAAFASQSGIALTWKKLQPDFSRVNPLKGFARLFSTEALVRLALGLLKIGLIGAVAYYSLPDKLDEILRTGALHPGGAWSAGGELVFRLALNMALVLVVLGIIDYVFQRYKLLQSLRMTKQEVRDEMKRMEGDPLLKQRRRQVQAKLAMQRLAQEVPKADVVITNPTEFAVAIKYDGDAMAAPRVVAKGQDLLALRIRQLAQQNRIPIVQRPPLARALFAAVAVGEEVPATFYKAVAEVLAYVYQLSGRAAARAD